LTAKVKLTTQELHLQFLGAYNSFRSGSWRIAVFEGSPEEGLYSWCPDCIVASNHLRRYEKKKQESSNISLSKFKVGTKKEWESKTEPNPFKKKFPYLSDVPTAILFFGKLDTIRIIAPRESDFELLVERVEVYKEQIESKDWHPPLLFTSKRDS